MNTVQFEMKFDFVTLWKILLDLRPVRIFLGALVWCAASAFLLVLLVPETRMLALVVLYMMSLTVIVACYRFSVSVKESEFWGSTVHVVVDDSGLRLFDDREMGRSEFMSWWELSVAKEHFAYYELCGSEGRSELLIPKNYPLAPAQAESLRRLLTAHTTLR